MAAKLDNLVDLRLRSFGVIWMRISAPKCLDHGASKVLVNPWPESGIIVSFDAQWSRKILNHCSWSRSPQRNPPKFTYSCVGLRRRRWFIGPKWTVTVERWQIWKHAGLCASSETQGQLISWDGKKSKQMRRKFGRKNVKNVKRSP